MSIANPRFSGRFKESCLLIAKECYGPKGIWAHQGFDYLNRTFFGDRLPHPHIIWGLTPFGGCYAWASCAREGDRKPVITLHPGLLEPGHLREPWGIPRRWLGPALLLDVLLHECIHIHIDTHLGGTDGPTSHNCDRWVRQINRLAPMLGFDRVQFGRSKLKRIPIAGAPLSAHGKRPTKVTRISTGTVPFIVGAGFPISLRQHKGTAGRFYSGQCLPIDLPKP